MTAQALLAVERQAVPADGGSASVRGPAGCPRRRPQPGDSTAGAGGGHSARGPQGRRVRRGQRGRACSAAESRAPRLTASRRPASLVDAGQPASAPGRERPVPGPASQDDPTAAADVGAAGSSPPRSPPASSSYVARSPADSPGAAAGSAVAAMFIAGHRCALAARRPTWLRVPGTSLPFAPWTSRPRSAPAAPTRRSSRSRSTAETLDELFDLARWAPNHHLTNPWRFRVLGPARARAAQGGGGPEAASKLDRAPTLVVCSCVLGGDPVQDEEDLHATACAAYIVLLAAHARGPGRLLADPGGAAHRGRPRRRRPRPGRALRQPDPPRPAGPGAAGARARRRRRSVRRRTSTSRCSPAPTHSRRSPASASTSS